MKCVLWSGALPSLLVDIDGTHRMNALRPSIVLQVIKKETGQWKNLATRLILYFALCTLDLALYNVRHVFNYAWIFSG